VLPALRNPSIRHPLSETDSNCGAIASRFANITKRYFTKPGRSLVVPPVHDDGPRSSASPSIATAWVYEEKGRRLADANVEVRIGDGYHGWPEATPFDSIVVTAAPQEIPSADRPAQARRTNGDSGRSLRHAVCSASGKAAGRHHHDEAHAASEVRVLHERSSEIAARILCARYSTLRRLDDQNHRAMT
jgi:Protein-L-isoaspartate(D-aspartate) O-methyltransferase (PCMT)